MTAYAILANWVLGAAAAIAYLVGEPELALLLGWGLSLLQLAILVHRVATRGSYSRFLIGWLAIMMVAIVASGKMESGVPIGAVSSAAALAVALLVASVAFARIGSQYATQLQRWTAQNSKLMESRPDLDPEMLLCRMMMVATGVARDDPALENDEVFAETACYHLADVSAYCAHRYGDRGDALAEQLTSRLIELLSMALQRDATRLVYTRVDEYLSQIANGEDPRERIATLAKHVGDRMVRSKSGSTVEDWAFMEQTKLFVKLTTWTVAFCQVTMNAIDAYMTDR